jgi:RIP homotypic interaction motif
MKFVASIVALLLAFWIAVKLGLLAYHGLLHLLHLMIRLVPFLLGAAGACALGALGYAVVTWWIRRREMAAHRKARRGGADRGSVAPLTARPAHVAAPAGNRSARRPGVTGPAEAAGWKPSARRASDGTAAPASSLRKGPPTAASQRSAAGPARPPLPSRTAVGYYWPSGNNSPSRNATPIARSARPVSPLTRRADPARPGSLARSTPATVQGLPCIAPTSLQPTMPGRPSSPPPPGDLERVILIDRCSGVQVGRDNDQYTTCRVSLPTAALQSSQALADQLLRRDVPWSRDVFRHDARPALGAPAGGFRASSHGLVAGPGGDTLVIVRNSRGVQVGNHNVQHNQFRIRVADVTVRANGLGMTTARGDAISRLRANPGDQGAARGLAEDVARAANTKLTLDVTAKLARDVGHPQVGWPTAVHNRTGIQAGDHNRARVTIKVTVSRLETQRLEHQLRRSAEKLARMTAKPRETLSRPAPPRITRDGPAAPRHGRGIGIGF